MKEHENKLQAIELDDLELVGGGAGASTALKKGGKFLLKKAGPIGLAVTAYDGVSAGVKSYNKGNSWGTIAKDAAVGAIW